MGPSRTASTRPGIGLLAAGSRRAAGPVGLLPWPSGSAASPWRAGEVRAAARQDRVTVHHRLHVAPPMHWGVRVSVLRRNKRSAVVFFTPEKPLESGFSAPRGSLAMLQPVICALVATELDARESCARPAVPQGRRHRSPLSRCACGRTGCRRELSETGVILEQSGRPRWRSSTAPRPKVKIGSKHIQG